MPLNDKGLLNASIPDRLPSEEGKPEVIKEPEQSNLSDKAAALHNIFFAIGSIAGPPLGGGLYDAIDWRHTCQIMASISLFFSLVYGVVIVCYRNRK